MKAMKSEMKENVQGTTVKGRKPGLKLDQKEEINIQPEQSKETKIQKT